VANLPLAFAELLGGGVLLTAGISGQSIQDVFAGSISLKPFDVTGGAGAGAGSTSAAPASGGASVASVDGMANPFARARSLNIGRVDQGVDASMAAGSPILAPFDSVLERIDPNWYRGQPGLFFRITSGPNAGTYWYLAEQIDPTVKVGDRVNAGEQVASYAQSGTGIEIGWAANAVSTLAQATTGYVEGQATHAGQSFLQLLHSLGAGGYPVKGGAGAGQ
jgi:murein DD-endopeptidase MepM/ murein hydrolase activator NlpD